MRHSLLFSVLIVAGSFSCAAETVSLLDGAVQFTLPPGYSQLTPEETAAKFARGLGKPPLAVFGDQQRHVMIAFTLSQPKEPFTQAQLPGFLDNAPALYKQKVEGLIWHKEEIISSNGRQWGRMHYSVKNPHTDANNDMYLTSFQGKLFAMNLTAANKHWQASQPALMSVFQSIKIKE